MSRSHRLIAVGLAAALVAACQGAVPGGGQTGGAASPPAGGSPAAASCTGDFAKPSQLRLGFQRIPNGDIIVKQSGWLEQELSGVSVKWLPFDSGGAVNRAITANGVDIGLAGSSPVSRGVATGIPYVVPWIFDVIGAAEALAVKSSANIKAPQDLVGKKIGVPFVSTTHYSLLNYLRQNGIQPSQVQLLNMEPKDAVAAWKTGQIDAAYIWEPALGEIVKDGGQVLVDSAKMAELGFPTFDLAVARKDFANQYPCVMNIWAKVQHRAVTMIKSEPDKAAGLVGKEFDLQPAEAKRQMTGLRFLDATEQASQQWLGGDLAKALKQTAQYLVDQKEIPKLPDDAAFQGAVVKTYAEAATK
ncbi:MAG: ABC transporter substrate-binding protein [Chloroflexota bacterium]|nr:ABC transporter substrate-binding protein [Chloroflexota bacterium]